MLIDGSYIVPVWLICHTMPTHTLRLSTGIIAPITRLDTNSGLPGYPVVSEGENHNLIDYLVLLFHTKVTA
jgi:hypothetical protein